MVDMLKLKTLMTGGKTPKGEILHKCNILEQKGKIFDPQQGINILITM